MAVHLSKMAATMIGTKIKQASAVIGKQVLAFGKSEKSEFIYIGSFGLSGVTRIWGPNIGLSGVTRIWGPNIGRSRRYRV